MFNESWKLNGAAPTKEDCIKYQRCKTRLLATSENWSQILEVGIVKVTQLGMIQVAQTSALCFGMGGVWMHADDLQIIEILPDLVTPEIFKEHEFVIKHPAPRARKRNGITVGDLAAAKQESQEKFMPKNKSPRKKKSVDKGRK